MIEILRRFRVALIAGGCALAVVGILGLALGWGSSAGQPASASGSASSGSTSSGSTSSTGSASSTGGETPQQFAAAFVAALLHGDRAFLFSRMDPAVIARYGAAQCQAATATMGDPMVSLTFVGATGPATFNYASSGSSTAVPDTYTFTFTGTAAGVSGTHQYHFALSGGRFHLFVNCSPSGGA